MVLKQQSESVGDRIYDSDQPANIRQKVQDSVDVSLVMISVIGDFEGDRILKGHDITHEAIWASIEDKAGP